MGRKTQRCIVALGLLLAACATDAPRRHAPGIAYYELFTGYNLPYRVSNEITQDETRGRGAYMKATYDASGQLVVLESWKQGSLFFRHEYEYDEQGQPVRATITERNGVLSVREL